MKRYFFIISFSLALFACKQEKPGGPPHPAGHTACHCGSGPAQVLPSVPLSTLQMLFTECDHVDYIFYDLPMSMSVDEKPSIQNALRFIAEDPASIRPECKATGRVSYHVKGNIILEADFYFSNNCTYFIFYRGKEKAYGNLMTENGVVYFKNLIEKGLKAGQQ